MFPTFSHVPLYPAVFVVFWGAAVFFALVMARHLRVFAAAKPVNAQPIGSQVASATLGGQNWNVWYGTNSGNGKPCVSYVAQTDIKSLTYSLGDFIQDAVGRTYVKTSWSLTNVFAGFEIWNGGVGLAVTDFSVNVP